MGADLYNQYDPDAAPSQGFDQLPAGTYEAQIVDSGREPVSKKANKGDCLSLTWKVLSGEYKDRQIWQRMNMWGANMTNLDTVKSIAMSEFAAVREATGKKVVQNSEELHYIPCLVTIGPQKDNPQYTEVKSVKPLQQNYSPGGGRPPAGGASSGAGAASKPAAAAGDKPWHRAHA